MRALLPASLAAALLTLSACGDGGGAILTPPDDDDNPPPAACTATTCGEVRVALTDGDGDFLSYAVDLVSIRLEKANGDDAEVLPTRQRVDFATLADVSEFLAAQDIPNGTYERAVVRLDYTDAEVAVEVDGAPTPAEVVDASADALGVVDLEITFDDANPLVVASGTPALLQLDFDLEASHAVVLGTTPVTVTAAPFLVAAIEPRDDREFRARGPLVSVDESDDSLVLDLRPFDHATAENGEFTIRMTADTACEVGGDELAGDDCIAALADLPADAPIDARGAYDLAARTFTATRLLAAGSVAGAEADTVIGVVAARNFDDLTLRGGTVVRQGGGAAYAQGDIKVTLDSSTEVRRDGGSGPTALDIDAISVGQRIQAFGDASASDFNPTLDARGRRNRVRLYDTHLTGFVVGATRGELRLDLVSIDGRDPQFFDFDRTGTSLITEANPHDYQLDTGTIDLGDFDDGEGAEALGIVAPFGSAPPDFEATRVTAFEELRALLGVGWGFDGTTAPFTSMGQAGFVIDIRNLDLGERHFLEIGPRVFDITRDLPAPIRVEPPDDDAGLFAIASGLEVEVFGDFGDFVTRVNSRLANGDAMRSFTARGTFDTDRTVLEADYVAISFVEP